MIYILIVNVKQLLKWKKTALNSEKDFGDTVTLLLIGIDIGITILHNSLAASTKFEHIYTLQLHS